MKEEVKVLVDEAQKLSTHQVKRNNIADLHCSLSFRGVHIHTNIMIMFQSLTIHDTTLTSKINSES